MARPREFDEDRVKDALMNVFWEKGYEATSMQDLVAATGLLKGSLYGAFGDKQALYLAALEHYEATQIQLGVDMLGGKGSPREKVSRLFDTVIESANTGVFAGGCLLCNASVEMAAADAGVRAAVQKQIQRLKDAVHKAINVASSKQDAELKAITNLIVTAYFGARVIAKAGMPISMIETSRDMCLNQL